MSWFCIWTEQLKPATDWKYDWTEDSELTLHFIMVWKMQQVFQPKQPYRLFVPPFWNVPQLVVLQQQEMRCIKLLLK